MPNIDPNNPYDNPAPGPRGPLTGTYTNPTGGQGTAGLQSGLNNAFQNYAPQNGVGGGQGFAPSGGAVGGGGTAYPAPSVPGAPGAPAAPPVFQPTTPLQGDFNMQWGGPGEQFYAQTAGQYQQPSASEAVFATHGGQLGNQTQAEMYANAMIPGMTADGQGEQWYAKQGQTATPHQGDSNMAAQVFQDYQRTAARDPGMGAYYDNAGRQALEKINQNAAARGVYGSSAALAEGTESLTNLAADRARNEAQYNLDRLRTGGVLGRSAEDSQRGWYDSQGTQAFAADSADLARDISGVRTAMEASQLGLDRLGQMSDMAGQADQSAINRLVSGQNAAAGAQNSREQRIGAMFEAIFGAGKAVSDDVGAAQGQMTQDQINLLTQANNASMGAPATALNYDTYEANQHRQEFTDWMELLKKFGGGGM